MTARVPEPDPAIRPTTRARAAARTRSGAPALAVALAVAVAVAAGVLLAACGGTIDLATTAPGQVRVVTTTTVLADLVTQVGGSRVQVDSLVPRGGEAHTFDPRPSDLVKVARADLVVMNGLGLDDWLVKLVADTGTAAPVVRLGEHLPGVAYLAGEGAGTTNPHLWLNVAYARAYVERIGEALAAVAPADAAAFRAGAQAYEARLEQLDGWVRAMIATIPESNRAFISFHDALPYFAAAYGLRIVGVVVPAPGQDPSAGQVADLVAAIKAAGVKAVFSESQFSPELAQTVAREAGATVVADLYTDTLGDPPADTYEGLIRWDVERFVAALR